MGRSFSNNKVLPSTPQRVRSLLSLAWPGGILCRCRVNRRSFKVQVEVEVEVGGEVGVEAGVVGDENRCVVCISLKTK